MASLGTNIDTLTTNCVLVEGDVASIQYIRHFRLGHLYPTAVVSRLNSFSSQFQFTFPVLVPKNLRKVAAMLFTARTTGLLSGAGRLSPLSLCIIRF